MIRIQRGKEPRGLRIAGPRRLEAAATQFEKFGAASREISDTLVAYGSSRTKEALFDAQHQKCAWCERESDFSSAQVEHYRPKNGAWRNLPGDPPLEDPGYYWWLTWTWTNLLFSCGRCNDAGHKANYFPLRAGTAPCARPIAPVKRPLASPLVDLSLERPLLLDPAGIEDPLDHIEWRPGNTHFHRREWTWTPEGRTPEGIATVAILRLGELSDRAQSQVQKRLLPAIEETEGHLAAGRHVEAQLRWNQLLADNFDQKTADWSAFLWHALGHLVPARFRSQHGLKNPTRPGAP